jgi:hypothetical protein
MMARGLRWLASFRAALGALIGVALMMVMATVVFACTYIPHLYAASPQSGVPGSDISLSGDTAAVNHPVTMRWNGLHGAVLGTVMPDAQGKFQTTVKVPDVAAGSYFIVADAGGSDVARAHFQVTGSAGAAGVPQAPAVAPETTTVPSLDGATAESSWLTSALMPGLVLFTLGTVGVVGGFSLVLARRRRVPTRAS